MKYKIYRLAYGLLERLPWILIEVLVWIAYLLVYYVLRYRRGVVKDNLEKCFPSLEREELASLSRAFYYHFIYQLIASPKLLYQKADVIARDHLQLEGMELFAQLREAGHKHFIVLMGHCGNWELFSAGQIYFSRLGIQQEQLYRPLSDEALDRVQKEIRSRHGSICTPKASIGRRLVQMVQDETSLPTAFAFIADQTPSRGHVGLWETFLERETAFLDGAERLARKFDLPVIYMRIERESQRHYRGRMQLISSQSRATEPHEITRTYIRLLEQNIRDYPTDWLWSHKRWKLSREEDETKG